jgi:hypothetical protein
MAAKRHDCRRTSWLIAGGYVIWCYQCGAWRNNGKGKPEKSDRTVWYRPVGIGGKNPALSE